MQSRGDSRINLGLRDLIFIGGIGYLLLGPLMEQFASNFPISNNISAANVEWFDRPTHNTDKWLSGPKAGGDGERGRAGGGGREHQDRSPWLPDEWSLQVRRPRSVHKPLWPTGVGGECVLLGTWAQAGWTAT